MTNTSVPQFAGFRAYCAVIFASLTTRANFAISDFRQSPLFGRPADDDGADRGAFFLDVG